MIRRVPQANLKVACPACGQKLDASDVLAFQHVECPACKSELMIPYRFGQYLLEEPLSESHLAGVYRALDLKLDREVAIKVLDEDLAENEMLVEHFLKLGRRIALLNHSNIIPIYSSGTFKELPYLVMELMEDFSLRDMLHQTDAPPPCDQSLHIAEQVARGLEAANREGVHHHNLNPANILLGPGNVVKLTDFGMAAVWEAAMNEHTEQAGEYPDAGYMSPELLKGEQADCRAD
ncbi:MAG: protein kinase, partial [Candidatus Pacebacteria bacterium]|nr:protein kinase [Candidatus Paceibacterota bacterium]